MIEVEYRNIYYSNTFAQKNWKGDKKEIRQLYRQMTRDILRSPIVYRTKGAGHVFLIDRKVELCPIQCFYFEYVETDMLTSHIALSFPKNYSTYYGPSRIGYGRSYWNLNELPIIAEDFPEFKKLIIYNLDIFT